jgi:predicted nucleic acid-binding protein
VAEAIVDANVLVRFLTEDPPAMAERADAVLQAAEERGVDLLVTPVTLAEVVFVLESVYGWKRRNIVDGLTNLFAADTLAIAERSVIEQALEWYAALPAVHFADVYICAVARQREHGRVISFDHAMRRVPGIRVIKTEADID